MRKGRTVAKRQKPKLKRDGSEEPQRETTVAAELGRVAKLLALYLMKDVGDETTKILRLSAVGFSRAEIASLLNKTENNVGVQISKAKAKRGE